MGTTIWFDITRIYNWDGPPVGFVRVELECTRNLLYEFGGQTRFCRYDGTRGTHREVPHENVKGHIQRLYSYEEAASAYSSTGTGSNMKRLAKGLIRRLPYGQQRTVIQFLRRRRRTVVKLKGMAGRIVGRGFAYVHPPADSIEPRLSRADVYVTLGLDSESNIFPGLRAIKRRTGIAGVTMCYDLIPFKFPHFLETDHSKIFSSFIIDMARCADKILCCSQNTLGDLEQFLAAAGKPCPPLAVLRLGSDIEAETRPVDRHVLEISRDPYILYVANIELRKNHEILYRAYKLLVGAGCPDIPRLVFVGRPGWKTESLLSDIRFDQSVNELIVVLDHISDSELSHLYRHALFTVYPSLYEGWGLPVAESLAYGKFCIASSASSVPEVGGDFAEYLDPNDLHGWARRLEYYFSNKEAVRTRETEIRLHYKPYPWAQTVRTLIDYALGLEEKTSNLQP